MNDLESVLIQHIVQNRLGADVIDLQRPWGGEKECSFSELLRERKDDINKTVLLVEMGSTKLQNTLEAMGKEVVVIDHHLYQSKENKALDLRSDLSSLEQVILLFDIDIKPGQTREDLPPFLRLVQKSGQILTLDNLVQLASANDRGHIPLLAKKIEQLIMEGGLPKETDCEALLWKLRTIEMTLVECIANNQDIDELADTAAFGKWSTAVERMFDEAVNYLKSALASNNAQLLTTARNKPGDPELWLIHAPVKYRRVMYDALYAWRAEQGHSLTGHLGALILFHADSDSEHLKMLEFYGQDSQSQALGEWFDSEIRKQWGTQRLKYWAGGSVSCFFGAQDMLGSESDALSRLADGILNAVLTGNRPLARWRTSFMQPLMFKNPAQKALVLKNLHKELLRPQGGLSRIKPSDEGQRYFFKHVQKPLGLAGSEIGKSLKKAIKGNSIQSVERRADDLNLHLNLPNHKQEYALPIRSLRMHFFYNEVMILEWVVSDEETAPEDLALGNAGTNDDKAPTAEKCLGNLNRVTEATDPPLFWRQCLSLPGKAPLSLAQLLDINCKARQCYSTYKSDKTEKRAQIRLMRGDETLGSLCHAGQVDQDDIIGWFKALLGEALGCGPSGPLRYFPSLELLSDDRARVFCSAVPVGEYPQTPWGREHFEAILARFNTVEEYGQGHFYYPPFALKELRDGIYDRFRSDGALYACTSHSMVFLGFGEFAHNFIHKVHMATTYCLMFITSLFYQAILNSFFLKLGILERESVGRQERLFASAQYQELRKSLTFFTNNLWFHKVSSQVQGEELFSLLNKQFGLEDEYALVCRKIERAEELYSSYSRQRGERFQWALAVVALPATLLTALLAIVKPPLLKTFWSWLTGYNQWLSVLSLVIVSCLPVGLGYLVYLAIKQFKKRA